MLTFQPSVMAKRKSNVNEIAKVQHELLDYMDIVKGEISDAVVLLEQFMEESYDKGGPTHDELEKLLKKVQKAALAARGVQDYILEIDSPDCRL